MHPQEKGRENMQNKMMKKYFPVFVLPTLLAFTIGFIVPFIMGVYLSFCKFTTVTDAKFVGLQNYVKIFTEDGTFGHALWYTTAFTVVSVVLINVIGFAVALLLTKKIKGTNIFRTVFFMPNLIGGIILGYVWQLLLNGLLLQINKTLTYSSVYGFWGLVILMCWQQIGYMMIYIAGIQNIPGELIEAAQIDGANKGQLLKHVIIPMVMPSITICTFLTLTNSFKLFDQNLALTNGEPSNMSEMLALNIYNTFYGRTGWEGVGQAKAVIFFILVGAIAMIQNRLTRSKEVQQ